MDRDLTCGPVMRSMLRFAVPMILGNLLQQCYNIADTLIVGKLLGKNALAAVGSSFTLMTFLTSILLGLCMGSGALFSIRFGQRSEEGLRESIRASFVLIAGATVLLNVLAFAALDFIRVLLRVPEEVWGLMRAYLRVIFCGVAATFLYNYFASFLRSVGNSIAPLVFLAVSALLNIALDLWFVLGLKRGDDVEDQLRDVLRDYLHPRRDGHVALDGLDAPQSDRDAQARDDPDEHQRRVRAAPIPQERGNAHVHKDDGPADED